MIPANNAENAEDPAICLKSLFLLRNATAREAAPCAILEHNSPIQIKFSYPVVAIIPNLIGVNA